MPDVSLCEAVSWFFYVVVILLVFRFILKDEKRKTAIKAANRNAKEHREKFMKACPVCRKFIAKTAESCPKCGHVF